MRKAKVLPLPVIAAPSTSLPCNAGPMLWRCTGVGALNLNSESAFSVFFDRGNCENVLIVVASISSYLDLSSSISASVAASLDLACSLDRFCLCCLPPDLLLLFLGPGLRPGGPSFPEPLGFCFCMPYFQIIISKPNTFSLRMHEEQRYRYSIGIF